MFVFVHCRLCQCHSTDVSPPSPCLPRPLHSHWALATPFLLPLSVQSHNIYQLFSTILYQKNPLPIITQCLHFYLCLLILDWSPGVNNHFKCEVHLLFDFHQIYRIWSRPLLLSLFFSSSILKGKIIRRYMIEPPLSLLASLRSIRARCPNYQIIFHWLDLLPGTPHPITG